MGIFFFFCKSIRKNNNKTWFFNFKGVKYLGDIRLFYGSEKKDYKNFEYNILCHTLDFATIYGIIV